MASAPPMATQCDGFAKASEPPSAASDPCLKRPAGNTVIAGQVAQSRMTVPGFGRTGVEATGAGGGTGVRCAKNQATATSRITAAPMPMAGATPRRFQSGPRATEIFFIRFGSLSHDSTGTRACTGDDAATGVRASVGARTSTGAGTITG